MKDKSKVRSRIMVVYVTEQEYEEISKAAIDMDMSFSSFLKKAALLLAGQELKN